VGKEKITADNSNCTWRSSSCRLQYRKYSSRLQEKYCSLDLTAVKCNVNINLREEKVTAGITIIIT